jgi:hypothetical protein
MNSNQATSARGQPLPSTLAASEVFLACGLPRLLVPRRKCHFPAHNIRDSVGTNLQDSPHLTGRRHVASTNDYRAGYYRHRYPHCIAGRSADAVNVSDRALPAFPAIEIDGRAYWDSGIVSNTPLWYVFDNLGREHALILQVDLFNAEGPLPRNIDEVEERQKDIQ